MRIGPYGIGTTRDSRSVACWESELVLAPSVEAFFISSLSSRASASGEVILGSQRHTLTGRGIDALRVVESLLKRSLCP